MSGHRPAVASWFEVDKDGLKEMFADFPPERLVMELIQNVLDENGRHCRVSIKNDGDRTVVTVEDDNPDGFKSLRDAYTLFRSTDKRKDPDKRGRFNLGEKLVFARAEEAAVITTSGTLIFNAKGRKNLKAHTAAGSMIRVKFTKWEDAALAKALEFLEMLYVPKNFTYELNGRKIPWKKPMKETSAFLTTEYLHSGIQGNVMRRTTRKTRLWFYVKQRSDSAYLYEMGIPVCKIEGRFDANVQQKVPLALERNMVSTAYLQDIYAELLMAMHEHMRPDDLCGAYIRLAIDDDRMNPETAAAIFKQQFSNTAVLQSHDPDSDQEAARAGAVIVSSKTFGKSVNDKLRQGGVATTKEKFCRNKAELEKMGMPSGYKEVKDTAVRAKFRKFVKVVNSELYGKPVEVKFASWAGGVAALYERGSGVTFNVRSVTEPSMLKPVSDCSGIVLHELAHVKGGGHDSVYDREYEHLVNRYAALLLTKPGVFRDFEPELEAGIRDTIETSCSCRSKGD